MFLFHFAVVMVQLNWCIFYLCILGLGTWIGWVYCLNKGMKQSGVCLGGFVRVGMCM